MAKERIAAIVIGLLMIGSILGFALMSARQPVEEQKIGNIINRQLTAQEKIAILQSGKVLIEFGWPEDCQTCQQKQSLYLSFVQAWPAFVVLSDFSSDQTIDHMIGRDGQIVDLTNISTQEDLFGLFCQQAILQPKECLLAQI